MEKGSGKMPSEDIGHDPDWDDADDDSEAENKNSTKKRTQQRSSRRWDTYEDDGKVIRMSFNELTKGVKTYAAIMDLQQYDHFELYASDGNKIATVQPIRKKLKADDAYDIDEQMPNDIYKELLQLAQKEEDAIHLKYRGKIFGTLLPFISLEQEQEREKNKMVTAYHTKPSTLVSENITKTTVTEFFRGASDVYADILRKNKEQEYHLFMTKKNPEIVAVVKPWVGQKEKQETDINIVVVAKSIAPFYNMVAGVQKSETDNPARIVFGSARGKAFTPFAVCELIQTK